MQPLLRRALGEERTLRMLLNIERVSWRLAFEAAGTRYGDSFANLLALDTATIEDWLPPRGRVIDVGCGSGAFGRLLAPRVESYLGIDHDPRAIAAARNRGCPPHVTFEVNDARTLPHGRFDAALLVHVLEHIDDPVALLQQLSHLAPLLIIEVPDFNRDILNAVRLDLGLDFSSDDDHVREYTEPLLQEQLGSAGWRAQSWARSPGSIAVLATR